MAAGGGPVSARALARSVAHRLKENSFDSSGLIRDEMESSGGGWCTHPTHLSEWEHGQPLEHDFAKIKLEASLRMYVGSMEECHQKVHESPGKQKDLERFIKKMARDYVPDLTNDGRAKRTQSRQSYWQRTPSSLHRAATPSMSAEEVRRIVSSASKLIVGATSEVSPKVSGTTREVVSTPKRRATKATPGLDQAWEQSVPSTRSHREEAQSIQEWNEEFRPKLNQKASEKNGGQKPKTTKKKKNVKCRERPTEISSNISRNSYKSNREFSPMLPKSNDSCSVSIRFPSQNSPPEKSKVFRRGILKNRPSVSCTSSEKSEHQNIDPNSHWKGYLHPLAGCPYRLVEIRRKKSPCAPTGVASTTRSSRFNRPLARQPVLTSRYTPEVTGNKMEVCSVKRTAEEIQAKSSVFSEKTRETYNSKVVSGCAILNGQGKKTHDEANEKSKFPGKSQRDWPEETKGGLDGASERSSESHQVHFQMLQQGYCPKNVERQYNSESCNLDNFRQLENVTLPVASADESSEALACHQENQDQDHILTVTRGPSLGYQVCQGEDQNAPSGLTMDESTNADGNAGSQDIKEHSGKLLNQILSLHEGDAKALDGPTCQMQINDAIWGEPWDQRVVFIPPMLPGIGETSEEEDGSSASSGVSTPVPGRLGNEASDEEFTISSASSTFSAKSLASAESRNTNGEQEEGEDAGSSAEIRVPNLLEESTIRGGMFEEHGERLSSSAEEKRTNRDRAPEDMSAAQVVYFSHLPMSL